jgi:hypothetical protein
MYIFVYSLQMSNSASVYRPKLNQLRWKNSLYSIMCTKSPECQIENPGDVYCKNHWFYWLQEGVLKTDINKTLSFVVTLSPMHVCIEVYHLAWKKPYSGLICHSFNSRELTLSADSEWDVSVSVLILKRRYAHFLPSLLLGFHVARLSRTDILYTDGPSCELLY